jgi:hypothetical protein
MYVIYHILFFLSQRRQRTPEIMVNTLLHEDSKHNREEQNEKSNKKQMNKKRGGKNNHVYALTQHLQFFCSSTHS